MDVLFEVILAPAARVEHLLTEETLRDTQAQIITREEAEQLGVHSITDDPHGRDRGFIAVNKLNERYLQNELETHHEVADFRVHTLGL